MRVLAGALGVVLALCGTGVAQAETVSKRINFANEKWVAVGLSTEGIEVAEIRFKVEGGIHYNPLRLGKGPQCFVTVRNTGNNESKLAVAVAAFDDNGNLVGATETGHTGSLDPGERAELKMTFREVQRRLYEAKTVQITLETWK
jgi:hypothetical protein